MKTIKTLVLFSLAIGLSFLYSCEKKNVQNHTGDVTFLSPDNSRLSETITPLEFISSGKMKSDPNYTFTVIAEIDAPEHPNGKLGATDIRIMDNYLAITYNIAGDAYGGAIDLFSVDFDDSDFNITPIQTGIFDHSDANAVNWFDTKIFVASASDLNQISLNSSAGLFHFSFDGTSTQFMEQIDLPSYASNALCHNGSNLYVSSGSSGGISVFSDLSAAALTLDNYFPFDHLRSLQADAAGNIFALKTSPLEIIDNIGGSWNNHQIGSGIIPEAKSVLEVKYDHSFIAANNLGTYVLNNFDYSLTSNFLPEDVAHTSSEERLANGLSVGKRKLLVASGAAGLEVFHLQADISPVNIGTVVIPYSVNMVEFLQEYTDLSSSMNIGYFAIASGEGGLQIVKMVDNSGPTEGILTDSRDGQSYKTVKIGDQWWMAENLNYGVEKTTPESAGIKICYNFNSANCDLYGGLYFRPDETGLCPDGWHLPTDEDWKTLERTIGMEESEISGFETYRGKNEELLLMNPDGFSNGRGNNFTGFNALGAGFFYYHPYLPSVEFLDLGTKAHFWGYNEAEKTTWEPEEMPATREISSLEHGIDRGPYFWTSHWRVSFSIRCVKND